MSSGKSSHGAWNQPATHLGVRLVDCDGGPASNVGRVVGPPRLLVMESAGSKAEVTEERLGRWGGASRQGGVKACSKAAKEGDPQRGLQPK